MRIYRTIAILAMLSLATAAFSQSLEDNLRRHVKQICAPANLGRKAGTDGERKIASYLHDQLESAGVTMLSGREGDTFTVITSAGDTIASRNIVGIIEGSDPALREDYIVLGAHMDHLGTYTVNVDGKPQQRIYPGADANASGVAALVEAARIIAQDPAGIRRSLIVVGFGAMEQEFSGSRYFATAGGFSYIGNVKMMLNLDMLGRGTAENPFEIYPSGDPKPISSLMKHVLENESVSAIPAIHNGTVFPSDNLSFKQAGIPALTLSTGICREYRTVRDTPELIQYENLAAETVYIAAFARAVCNKDDLSGKAGAEEEKVYSMAECDTPPQFFRGPAKNFLEKWVYEYLKFPEEAIADGVDGFERVEEKVRNMNINNYQFNPTNKVYYKATVNVSFIVEADGNVSNVKIERGVSEPLDAEALRVVAASPKWKPGMVNGKKVRTKITIPVEFRLERR